MDNLIEFDRSKTVRTGGFPYFPIPRIIRQKYGITLENCKQFHIRYFHSADSDDIVLRIEKIEVPQ
jgi:hypothetical protein